jgi:integrase/recombinase XerD
MAGKKGIQGAALLAKRAQREVSRGGNPAVVPFDQTRPGSLEHSAELYLENLAVRNYTPDTIEGRRDAMKVFIGWAIERDLKDAAQITRPILESFQRWLWRYRKANGKPLGISTQRARLSTVKDCFAWLTRQNVLLSNPASELEMPRMERRLPSEVLSEREVSALMSVPNISDPLGIRDRAMLELFYSCGLRRAELARLELHDLNSDRQTLIIRQGKGRKDRVLPVGERALRWCERYTQDVRPRLALDSREKALFLTGYGEAFNPDVISRMVSAFIEAAGVSKKGSCHLLRHTCATHMLEGGADIRFIQQLLGHAKLDTTAIYTDVSIKQLQDVHRRCHPAARNTAPPACDGDQASSLVNDAAKSG